MKKIKQYFDGKSFPIIMWFNFAILYYNVIQQILYKDDIAAAAYFVALMWCIMFYCSERVSRRLIKIAMEGWQHAIDACSESIDELNKILAASKKDEK